MQLPDVFADAYTDQPKAREASITLWGVPLDPTKPQSDARVSVILMKFLRARWCSFCIFFPCSKHSVGTWVYLKLDPCSSIRCAGGNFLMSKRLSSKITPKISLEMLASRMGMIKSDVLWRKTFRKALRSVVANPVSAIMSMEVTRISKPSSEIQTAFFGMNTLMRYCNPSIRL